MVLSIAAGVTLATLEEAVPDRPVVRAMPNTAALVRKGAAAIAGGRHATEAHLDEAERILGSVGVVVRVPEELLDAVTGLSGSGPAYVFLLAQTLAEAGVAAGLPAELAARLARATVSGAGALLEDPALDPAARRFGLGRFHLQELPAAKGRHAPAITGGNVQRVQSPALQRFQSQRPIQHGGTTDQHPDGVGRDRRAVRIRERSGNYRVGEFIQTPQLRNGRVVGILGVGRDVTERQERLA